MPGPLRVRVDVTAGPAAGRTFEFDEPDTFLFGRSADSRVSLPDDPYVSRHHFLLEVSPPDCKVTDLGSKNGTFVNDVRVKDRQLVTGDVLAFGETRVYVWVL